MIDNNRVTLVLCLTVVAVVAINLMIVSVLRRGPGSRTGQIELLRRAAKTARQPWQEEDDNLSELARRVQALKQTSHTDENPPTPKDSQP